MLTGFQSVSAFLAFFIIIWTLVNFKRECIPKDAISYYVILKKKIIWLVRECQEKRGSFKE